MSVIYPTTPPVQFSGSTSQSVLPIDGYSSALILLALATAGPTWSQQPTPWFTETAPLIIAIEVTDSMRSNDLAPTRQDRARFKIMELLELRTGARTGLIAYAGTSHIVVPPTTDTEVFKNLLESLTPEIMPTIGTNAANVLPIGLELLKDQVAMSTLLFVNDGFDSSDVPAFEAFSENLIKPELIAWIIGTEEGGIPMSPEGLPFSSKDGSVVETKIDQSMLKRIAKTGNISIIQYSNDNSDTVKIYSKIESNLKKAEDPNSRWEEQDKWVIWPAAIILLISFRKGWTQRW